MIKYPYKFTVLFILSICIVVFSKDLSTSNPTHGYSKRETSKNIGSSRSAKNYKFIGTHIGSKTVKLYAFRVEFQPDSTTLTTGNGLFGIRKDENILSPDGKDTLHKAIPWSITDKDELDWYYENGLNVYRYDRLPHNKSYIKYHLDFLKDYYSKISKNNLTINYEIFPKGDDEKDAYRVPREMFRYSPSSKKTAETNSEFNIRRTSEMMKFIQDAISIIDTTEIDSTPSPFSKLSIHEDGSLWEDSVQVFIMIIHAGASILTDGGHGGSGNANSQADMSNSFITEPVFRYYYNEGNVFNDRVQESSDGTIGVIAIGKDSTDLYINEVMMVPEMSNQDSLNYGINGILVNQFARQLGIPDLYSTTAGISGVGAFGVMDFAGYSAGQGFIPPNPSAWVRVAMGWDSPTVLDTTSFNVPLRAIGTTSDTTTLLIPINNHEYYLIENRQRNIAHNPKIFYYDTLKTDGKTNIHISSGFQVNLKEAIDSTVGVQNVVMKSESQDIGIPASGALIWHIDEDIISNRLQYNLINADSSYRGISLEEADGVVDIGVKFSNVLGQSQFDYGGSEDVFPHTSSFNSSATNVMNSKTSPSTESNDGGNSFLSLTINNSVKENGEVYLYNRGSGKYKEYYVTNYPDSTLLVSVDLAADNLSSNSIWRKRNGNSKVFDITPIDFNNDSIFDIAVIDSLGYLSVYNSTGKLLQSTTTPYSRVIIDTIIGIKGYTSIINDTISYTDSITDPFTFPTVVHNRLLIPTKDGVTFVNSISNTGIDKSVITLNSSPSTNIIGLDDSNWAVATSSGVIYWGDGVVTTDSLSLPKPSSVTSIAQLGFNSSILTVTTEDKNLYIINRDSVISTIAIETNTKDLIYPPFKMATGDLNGDSIVEIVVTDLKQGLWIFETDKLGKEITYHSDFQTFPNDWAGIFKTIEGRDQIPNNGSNIALSDINGDGNIDIILSGSNGVYAFNHRGVIISGWPSLLDRTNWEARKSVLSSPVIAYASDSSALTIFSSPTGDNITYHVYKALDTATDIHNEDKYVVYYNDSEGNRDSVKNLTKGFIDTMFTENDSLIVPYIAPGGGIDCRNSSGKRPSEIIKVPQTIEEKRFSQWPITVGGTITTSPLLFDLENNGKIEIVSLNDRGFISHWEVDSTIISSRQSSYGSSWSMVGSNTKRSFTLNKMALESKESQSVKGFYSYPNPLRVIDNSNEPITFRYELGAQADNVSLDIYTMTGYKIIHRDGLFSNIGTNEYRLKNMNRFGSAVYRAILTVKFSDKEITQFWKIVILKGSK